MEYETHKKKSIKKAFVFLPFILVVYNPLFLKTIQKLGLTTHSFQGSLIGYTDYNAKPQFSKKNYASGTFQRDFEKWLPEHICFRSYYIRFYNQICFSLFRQNNRVLGKHNNIFESVYIETECGLQPTSDFRDAKNYKMMEEYVEHLEHIQKKLEKIGKHLIFYNTPSKATVNYNDIPLKFRLKKDADYIPPYVYLKGLLKKTGIPYLDSRDFFSTDGIPDFYPTGIHWARPIEQRMSKALVEKMEEISGKKFPEIMLHKMKSSEKPFWRDADVFNLSNTMMEPRGTYFEYESEFSVADDCTVPVYLLQGGSFAEGFYYKDYEHFKENSYNIFYNRVLRNDSQLHGYRQFSSWEEIDFAAILENIEFVIIEQNEAVIPSFSDGFVAYFDSFLTSYIEQKGAL